MKNSVAFITILAGTIVLSMLLPWWIIAPMALCLAYFARLTPLASFLISFVGVFIAWVINIYIIDSGGAVQELLGNLFEVNQIVLPYISSALGGLLAGIFGLSGALLAPKD